MITIRRKERLAILCVICTLTCITLLSITAFIGGGALATTSYQMNTGRDWQIAKVDDVFTNTIFVQDPVAYMPTSTDNQPSNSFSAVETQHTNFGVVLISYQMHPLHSGRALRLAHV